MARSRSSGSSRRSSPMTTTARKPAPAPAKTATSAPAPAPQQAPSAGGGMMGGLLGTVAEGMAWGTGTAIARRAVNSVMDSVGGGDAKETQPAPAPASAAPTPVAAAAAVPTPAANVCFQDQKAFLDCLNLNKNDISTCQFYLDTFNQCKQQESAYM